MTTVRAQVILHTLDAVPENYISNSWCFEGMAPGTDDAATVTMLKDFYDDIGATYWSNSIAQNGHEVKLSELPGVAPNYPFFEGVFNLAADPTGTDMPSELAICLSFQGLRSAGFPQSRRRGRVYLGPWGTTANATGRPTAALVTQIATAAATLKSTAAVIATAGGWAVWSGTDQAAVLVDDGWIDNAFDVQRRRGVLYTSRTTF
jgi:hypothetical protein